MNKKIKDWVLGFPCSRCSYLGIEKLGTVLVLGQDEASELQVIAFCYDCARVMMSSRRRPVAKRVTSPGDEVGRVIKLERRAAAQEASTTETPPDATEESRHKLR